MYAIVLIGLAIACSSESSIQFDDSAIISINGEPVETPELVQQVESLSLSGSTPDGKLRARVLESLTRQKVQQALLKQYGIVGDTSYTAFEKRWQHENQRRQRAIDRNEPIYGPKRYQKATYFEYELSNNLSSLKRRLSKSALSYTEAQLRDYYDSHREVLFIGSITTQLTTLEFRFNDHNREQQRQAAILAKEAVNQGVDVEDEARRHSDAIRKETTTIFKEGELRVGVTTNQLKVTASATPLHKAEVVELANHFLLIYCRARTLTYLPFEEVRQRVARNYLELQYKAMVDDLVRDARIVVSDPDRLSQILSGPVVSSIDTDRRGP